MIRFLRTWLVPPLFCLAAFLAGFIGFQPGWKKVEPLTDGSKASVGQTAKRIHAEDLLKDAAPQERVRWLLELCGQPPGLARDHALYEAIQHMQPGDFLAAFADLPTLGRELATMDQEVRAALIQASMERWLEVDRDGALRTLAPVRGIVESDALKFPPMGGGDLGTAYAVLAEKEPEWMHGQIDKLGKKTQRETAIRILIAADARRDPKKAREWLETFRGSKDWNAMFSAYLDGFAATDPRGAFEMVMSDERVSAGRRRELMGNLVLQAAGKSPTLVVEMLGKMAPEMARNLTVWAGSTIGFNGGNPIAWLADRAAADPGLFDVKGKPEYAARALVSPLIRHDPARALEFIATLPAEQQPVLRNAALAGWSGFNPDTFIDWLATQPPDVILQSPESLDGAAMRQPDRFADWVKTLPSGEARDRSELALVGALVRGGGAQEALAHFPPNATGDASAKTARELGGAIGAADPGAGAQWVAALPAGPAQKEAALGLAGTWAAQSPQAAAQWIEGLPAGETRDAATAAFASTTARADPQTAAEWLGQIQDPATRELAAGDVFRGWANADGPGAREWLRGLPGVRDAVKNALLSTRR